MMSGRERMPQSTPRWPRRVMSSVSRSVRRPALLTFLAALCSPAVGQELYGLGGGQYTPSLHENTYSYAIEYLENFNDYTYGTFTWLNEGHVTDHHRDGYSAQLWLCWLSASRRFTLSSFADHYPYSETNAIDGIGTTHPHHS